MTLLTGEGLRAIFDSPAPMTVGSEEELMLLDPDTLDLTPRSAELFERADGDPRFKLEMPAAQFEIASPALCNAADAPGLPARGASRRRPRGRLHRQARLCRRAPVR